MELTRRDALTALAATGIGGLSGCAAGPAGSAAGDGGDGATDAGEGTDDGADGGTPTESPDPSDGSPPPTADGSLHLPYEHATLLENVVSGGVGKDGIPSIDDPTFADPADVDLDPGDPVFGVVRNGVAKAYPQYVVVWHEIVNDTIGGDPVAVTYCPLTGTVQGFERGDAEFGVSGNLVNSNLVMYDRATDSWWPQVTATAIDGEMAGATLREFRVVWTTWENWRSQQPDTRVLTEDTGYRRRYGQDPYGNYNPDRGYYADDSTMFTPLQEDDRAHPKAVVLGARTADGAVAFAKERLLDEQVLTGDPAGDPVVAAADPALETGYVYANPDGAEVTPAEGEAAYEVDGETYGPTELPLDRVLAFDAMWFAWSGFYPDTGYVG